MGISHSITSTETNTTSEMERDRNFIKCHHCDKNIDYDQIVFAKKLEIFQQDINALQSTYVQNLKRAHADLNLTMGEKLKDNDLPTIGVPSKSTPKLISTPPKWLSESTKNNQERANPSQNAEKEVFICTSKF